MKYSINCWFILCFWWLHSSGQNQLIPLHSSSGQIIKHTFYWLSYSEEHEQAEWVSYCITPEFLKGSRPRSNDFRPDPLVWSVSANFKDYFLSGYDRGHLVPAGDMVYSTKSMSESFYYSNISPQTPSFNRGTWKKLESQVRDWGKSAEVIVVTGGVLTDDDIKKIGPNGVSVPKEFFKIIYDREKNEMIGFLMPNEKINEDLSFFIRSVDDIEIKTGIDFFIDLPDELETKLEASVNRTAWNFTPDSKK